MPKKVKANGKTFTFEDDVTNEQIGIAIDEYFAGIKKKVATQPTSQKKQLVSPTQQKPTPTLSDTEETQPPAESDGLGGPPKMKTFTGFTPEEQQTLRAKPVPKTSKTPLVKKLTLERELATTKVTPENQEEISRKTDELAAAIKEQDRLGQINFSKLDNEMNFAADRVKADEVAKTRLDDALTNTGIWNNIKSASVDMYNAVLDQPALRAIGVDKLKVDTDVLSEDKKEALKEAAKNKIELSDAELEERAKELYIDRQSDYIVRDNLNSFLDNLDEKDQNLLKQNRRNRAEHLQENNAKEEKVINAYEVIGNKKIKEYKAIEQELLKYKNTNQPLPKDIFDTYVSLGNEIVGIGNSIQKRQSIIDNNREDLGNVRQEFDLLKRRYGDIDNAVTNIGLGGTKILNGILGLTNYAAKFAGGAQGQIYSLAGQQVTDKISDYISDEESQLRKSVESIESPEGFVNYVSDIISKQIPNLVATSTGIGGLGIIGISSTGEKYTEMNREVLDGKATYSPLQMAVAPALWGSAEVISEIPTASILFKGKRLVDAILKNEGDLIKKSVKEKAKEWAKDWSVDMSKEITGEEFTNFTQNFTNKYILGKKDVGLLDNTGTVLKDTFTLTNILKAAPHVAGAILKSHQDNSDLNILDENSRKIIDFSKQLENESLNDTERAVITKQIDKATSQNSKIIANTIEKVNNMPDDVYRKIIDLNNNIADIKMEAVSINDGNLPNKVELIKSLETDYRSAQTERNALIDAKYEATEEVVAEVPTTEVISPENSSNYANLTEDKEGNFVFFHVGGKGYETIKKSTGGTLATSKEEGGALSKVGGVAMYYTKPSDTERMVNGEAKYAVTIPKEKVYDANTDPNNYAEEARTRHDEENPGKAFDANSRLAYMTKIAGENGFDMVVSEWMGRTRAQTTKEFAPKDVQLKEGDRISKPFEEEYVENTKKGYKSVIPESQETKLKAVYDEINTIRGREQKYDSLYRLSSKDLTNTPQEDITKLVEESDLPQEIKDKYAEAVAYKPGKRYTEAPVETQISAHKKNGGSTFLVNGENKAGSDASSVSIFTERSKIIDGEITEEDINNFKEANKDLFKGNEDILAIGTWYDSDSKKTYIDVSAVMPHKQAEQLGKQYNQKAVYNLKTNKEVDTGGTGEVIEGMKSEADRVADIREILNPKPAVAKSKLAAFKAKYIDKPVYDRTKLDTQVENAKKSLAKILPNVKFVVHDTRDSFIGVAGKNARGYYDPVTKTIHINSLEANARTVAHEVFHSVLLDKVKTDANARDLTKRMVSAISKTLEGNPELKKTLDDFVKNYDENIQNEEKIAELFGYLADGYSGFDAPTKSIIKKALDRLAVMFGLKPFTESEVVDMLKTLSGKVATGEEIVSEDVNVIKPAKTDRKGNLEKPSLKSKENLESKKFQLINDTKSIVKKGSIVSTRTPDIEGVHKTNNNIVDLKSLEKDQTLVIKIAKELSSYGLSKIENVENINDANKLIQDFKNSVKDNLKFLYDSFGKEVRDVAKLWYDGANKISNEIADKYGYSIDQVAGVMAVLSPQMDWFRNLSLGKRVIDIYKNQQDTLFDSKMKSWVENSSSGTGKNKKPLLLDSKEIIKRVDGKKLSELDIKDKAIFIRAYDEMYNSKNYENISPNGDINGLVRNKNGSPGACGWGAFPTIEKSISILENGSIENISKNLGNMHKVRNFFNNISNPSDPNAVTIDTHAVAAGLLLPLSGSSKEVLYNFGGASSKLTGSKGSYPIYADAYRELARELKILPRELQSITWEAVRGLFKVDFKSNKSNEENVKKVWSKYKNGETSIDKAHSDISDLAGGISKPIWYEYLADDNVKSLDENSAAMDQANEDLEGRLQESESYSDMKDIVKDMIDEGMSVSEIKKLIGTELGQDQVSLAERAYNELTTVKEEVVVKEPTGATEAFRDKVKDIPESGKVSKYLSGETIERVEGEAPRNIQEIDVMPLVEAGMHGKETVAMAKEVYGDKYIEKTLEFLDTANLKAHEKALLYVSLENEMFDLVKTDPSLKKLQDLVRAKSQQFLRESSLAINMGRLRAIMKDGFNYESITDGFLSTDQLIGKKEVEKAIQSDANAIQKEYESIVSESDIEQLILSGVEKQINEIYKKLPTARRVRADKAIAALEKIQNKLRGKAYDATIGLPLALIDSGITVIKNSIKAGVNIADAIELGINHIKEKYGKDWPNEGMFRDDMTQGFKSEGVSEKEIKAKELSDKDIVNQALIEAGFGKEITVKKEKRNVLDWKKLAGEEGSIDKLRENVEKIIGKEAANELEDEYNNLRASIIEKSLNELERRNIPKKKVNLKTSAKKLAEIYNYGAFEKESNTYDQLMNTVLGMNELDQKSFNEAKELAKSLSELFSQKDSEGNQLEQTYLKHAERVINKKIEKLLSKVAWSESNGVYKAVTIAKEFIGLAQRNALVSVAQAVENTTSGYISRVFKKIGFMFDNVDTKSLKESRNKLARMTFKDITLGGGLEFGDVTSPFITKSKTMDLIVNANDSRLYHALSSTALGKPFLESADSMHKAALAQGFFHYNLIKILRKKGYSKSEAKNYVSEQLTGQSFEDALVTAKQIIDKINENAGKKVIPDSKESIYRFANDLVNEALVQGNKITLNELEASLKSAETVAGFELGHEPNNIISKPLNLFNSWVQTRTDKAVKDKKWNDAAALTAASIVTTNILNPYVGGGTNWTLLAAQKAGIPTLSTIYWNIKSRGSKLDLSTEEGVKNLEKDLKYQLLAKNANTRMFIGAAVTLAAFALAKSTGADDDLYDWLKKNPWANKYMKKTNPPAVQFMLAQKDKKLGEFLGQQMNIKADAFDEGKKLQRALKNAASGKTQQALGGAGQLIGGRVSTPIIPWRVVRDVRDIYRGLNGLPEIKHEFKASGFGSGYFQGGMVEQLGLRPEDVKDTSVGRSSSGSRSESGSRESSGSRTQSGSR